jgi:hypothetical protein
MMCCCDDRSATIDDDSEKRLRQATKVERGCRVVNQPLEVRFFSFGSSVDSDPLLPHFFCFLLYRIACSDFSLPYFAMPMLRVFSCLCLGEGVINLDNA